MDIYSKIKDSLRNIAGNGAGTPVFPATVGSVDGETCTAEIDGLTVTGVRLRAVINGAGEYILTAPRAGSRVLVADLSGGQLRDLAVIAYSEIDGITVKIGTSELTVDAGGYGIERGGENLQTLLSEFVDEVAKIIVVQGTGPNVPALNAIKQRLKKVLK
jgi:hypothetical protein